MNPGILRHRITIQEERDGGKNRFNEQIKTWEDIATVWASIEPISGREYWAGQQVQSEITHRIRIRYRPGIKPAMRVLYQNRLFEIESVIDYQERHEFLQLMCKEVVR